MRVCNALGEGKGHHRAFLFGCGCHTNVNNRKMTAGGSTIYHDHHTCGPFLYLLAVTQHTMGVGRGELNESQYDLGCGARKEAIDNQLSVCEAHFWLASMD